MLSITAAAKHFNLPRDLILDAVRDRRLSAVRDRRGILRVDPSSVGRLCPPNAPLPAGEREVIIPLRVIGADRLAVVIAQQSRLLRELSPSSPAGTSLAHAR